LEKFEIDVAVSEKFSQDLDRPKIQKKEGKKKETLAPKK